MGCGGDLHEDLVQMGAAYTDLDAPEAQGPNRTGFAPCRFVPGPSERFRLLGWKRVYAAGEGFGGRFGISVGSSGQPTCNGIGQRCGERFVAVKWCREEVQVSVQETSLSETTHRGGPSVASCGQAHRDGEAEQVDPGGPFGRLVQVGESGDTVGVGELLEVQVAMELHERVLFGAERLAGECGARLGEQPVGTVGRAEVAAAVGFREAGETGLDREG